MKNKTKFRLIENRKVVGYELHEKGLIFHQEIDDGNYKYDILEVLVNDYRIVDHYCYIKHDNKDQYTGIIEEENNREVYKNDIYWECLRNKYYIVKYNDGGYILVDVSNPLVNTLDVRELNDMYYQGNAYDKPELLGEHDVTSN